ncbi:hypothetical protein V5O48_012524 [Marasmius crinis-equi]|uniref:HMG domain-containing protein n=1 Tax=Marasmius crinis-equi TaxID=585013 RepID=A0ABR3F2I9_9AGAR
MSQPGGSRGSVDLWNNLENRLSRRIDVGDVHERWNLTSASKEVWWQKDSEKESLWDGVGKGLSKRESPMRKRVARRKGEGVRKKVQRKKTLGAKLADERSMSTIEGSSSCSPSENMEIDDSLMGAFGGIELPEPEDGVRGEGVEDEDFEAYVDFFQNGTVGFIPIGTFLYVVQGWSKEKREPIEHWHHLEALKVGDNVRIQCLCPEGSKLRPCVHSEAYMEFRDERFRPFEAKVFRDGRVVWYWRELDSKSQDGVVWLNRFSVGAGGAREQRSPVQDRAMVSYLGTDTGAGVWTCSKCGRSATSSCAHRSAARAFFLEVMGRDEDLDEAEGDRSACEDDMMMFGDVNHISQTESAISYLSIRPPQWAELPTDQADYIRPSPTTQIPPRLTLLASNRSRCGQKAMPMGNDTGKVVKTCTIYTLTETLTREIEVQQCPVCPHLKHCFIGPDPRHLGLFNYNNNVLFTHEVLDEYTSRYTTAETPFAAFIEVMGRVYAGRGCKFIKEDLFRSVWFAYVSIQELSHDMSCPKCGDNPDCVIWDGVTLAFGRKHLLDSLKPPTFTDARSPICERRPIKKPQLIQDTQKEPIRKLLKRWIRGVAKKGKKQKGGNEDEEDYGKGSLEDYELLVARLMTVSKEAAALFHRTFALTSKIDPSLRRLYGVVFEQVAAEESALQMVNPRCIQCLEAFVGAQDWETASQLLDIPAIYNVLEAEFKRNGCYPRDLLDFCAWLLRRAKSVLSDVLSNGGRSVASTGAGVAEEDDWKKVTAKPKLLVMAIEAEPVQSTFQPMENAVLLGG